MIFENIFTNFWINVIILFIFLVFAIRVFFKWNMLKKSSKLKFNDIFVVLCVGMGFVVGVLVISFVVLPLEKILNSIVFILLKISLYLTLAYVLNKLWKIICAQGGE